MKIGVLGVQGAVSEHVEMLKRVISELDLDGHVHLIRDAVGLEDMDAFVIPGGESSTISRLLDAFEMRETLLSKIHDGMPVMGTCAGAVLLSSDGDPSVFRSDTRLLDVVDVSVCRNAFGRQRESFECMVDIGGIADSFHAVFIRAPSMAPLPGSKAKVLAKVDDEVVAVEQGNLLALSFHPELTGDTRVHRYFVDRSI